MTQITWQDFLNKIQSSATNNSNGELIIQSQFIISNYSKDQKLSDILNKFSNYESISISNCIFLDSDLQGMFSGLQYIKGIYLENTCQFNSQVNLAYFCENCKQLMEFEGNCFYEISGNYCMQYMFKDCESLSVVNFPNLISISGENAMLGMIPTVKNNPQSDYIVILKNGEMKYKKLMPSLNYGGVWLKLPNVQILQGNNIIQSLFTFIPDDPWSGLLFINLEMNSQIMSVNENNITTDNIYGDKGQMQFNVDGQIISVDYYAPLVQFNGYNGYDYCFMIHP